MARMSMLVFIFSLFMVAMSEDAGNESCPCLGAIYPEGSAIIADINGTKVPLSTELLSYCGTWETSNRPPFADGTTSDYECSHKACGNNFCYVDPCRCTPDFLPTLSAYFADLTINGRRLFYSYVTCGSEDLFTEENHKTACRMQKDEFACTSSSNKCVWKADLGRCMAEEFAGELKGCPTSTNLQKSNRSANSSNNLARSELKE
eukprot:TRINITY_DN37417_c0_g1_i1.p1 TRINITY_DN37417_c0_g1~~TRINITY_DN37417_c0_g1_i1.p1  ORF type:complete len:229 (+),score=25.62 TRINITY_DN37417_c0_g1_i1:74-688(+)